LLGLLSALRYDRTYFDKLVASLLPLLEKLTTGKIGKLIAPDYFDTSDERAIIDWTQIIRKRGIVYVGLDALTDTEVASAVGNSMFSDLVSTSGMIYKHGFEHGMLDGQANVLPNICLHADEFNELMGDEFLPMVNKSGGSGMQITAYTQSRGDIEARLGNTAKARQVEDNFNNLIMLRVKEKSTAELLTNQLPEVEITQKMTVSGASDSSDTENHIDFTSSTQDRISMLRVPMLETSHVTSLPKGQAYCLLDGGHLWKVRFPMPVEEDEDMPETVKALTEEMEKQYHTAEGWWKD
jgi:conjugative coupling factor TraD (SXT/TOL subfamily)